MDKKILMGFGVIATVAVLATVLIMSAYYTSLNLYGSTSMDFSLRSIHATITMTKGGVEIFRQYHAGAMTNLGANLTMGKLTGNFTNAYNVTMWNLNTTFVSIGNQGTPPSATTTVLPGEWNRTAAVMHANTYHSFNLTAVFYPGTGPYTADCIGINYEDGIANNALFGYDTFTEVTGIDSTFTITIEFSVTVS